MSRRILVVLLATALVAGLAAMAATSPTTQITSAHVSAAASGTVLTYRTPERHETPPPGTAIPVTSVATGTASAVTTRVAPGLETTISIKPTGVLGQNARASGVASLIFDRTTGNTAIQLQMQGLQPRSKHIAFINAGRCSTISPVLIPFSTFSADRNGRGLTSSMVHANFKGQDWSIQVHYGPSTTSGADFITVACGNLP